MTGMLISFEVREQEEPVPGWVVVARWPNGYREQLLGVYSEKQFAESWIKYQSAIWLRQRNAEPD